MELPQIDIFKITPCPCSGNCFTSPPPCFLLLATRYLLAATCYLLLLLPLENLDISKLTKKIVNLFKLDVQYKAPDVN